jgi:hypothetical protein
MSSFNGLKKIAATDIQNSGRFYLGNQVNAGTAGQALVSGGPNQPARWDIHTGTIQPLTMGANVSLASGNPDFDGSIPDTLNSVDTTYQGGQVLQLILLQIPILLIVLIFLIVLYKNSTISGISLGSNLSTITFYNSAGGFITSYNGANPPTSLTLDGDTTYTAGTNLTLVGTTFNLNKALTGIDSISFTSTATPNCFNWEYLSFKSNTSIIL